MTAFRSRIIGAGLAVMAALSASDVALADSLVTWELTGVNSPVSTVPATTEDVGVNGTAITRNGGLSDVSGSTNSFNSQGWNNSGAYVDLGFTLTPGTTATVDEFIFATRSSATGPGTMNVLYSVDGGAYQSLTTITQPSATYVDTDLTFAPITVTQSLDIRFEAVGTSSADGGTIGSTGSWRLSDFENTQSVFEALQLIGTDSASVPEPSSFALAGIGLAGGAAVMSRFGRKRPVTA